MTSSDRKLKYIQISKNSSHSPCTVFKINDVHLKPQVPQLRLFTDDCNLINQLVKHGFASNISLTSQIISLLGKIKADQLLIQQEHDLNKVTPKKLKQSHFKYDLITEIQRNISVLQELERNIPADALNKQYDLKLKILSIIQDYLYKIKAKSEDNFTDLADIFETAISAIYSYKFPNRRLTIHDQTYTITNRQGRTVTAYKISPNKIDRINSFEDELKFYLIINKFSESEKLKIKESVISEAQQNKKDHPAKLSVHSIKDYILNHPWRFAIFLFITLLEIICLPAAAPLLAGVPILGFLGFGNPFILIPTAITLTLSSINFIACIPQQIATFFSSSFKLVSGIFKHKNSYNDETITEDEQLYLTYRKTSSNIYPEEKVREPKIYSAPIATNITTFISTQYRSYADWFFSYIQRNPLLSLIYILFRCFPVMLTAFLPATRILYCTFLDIDRVIDKHHTDGTDKKLRDKAEILDRDDDLATVYSYSEHSFKKKSQSMTDSMFKATFRIFKHIVLKAPIALILTTSKLLLSVIYTSIYLLLNLIKLPFYIVGFELAANFILNIIHKVTNVYYRIFYQQDYAADYAFRSIDRLGEAKLKTSVKLSKDTKDTQNAENTSNSSIPLTTISPETSSEFPPSNTHNHTHTNTSINSTNNTQFSQDLDFSLATQPRFTSNCARGC